jgi:hypothetical protein
MDALQQRCDELDRDKQHMHEVHQTNLDKLAAQVFYTVTTYTAVYITLCTLRRCKLDDIHTTCYTSTAGRSCTVILGATHLAGSVTSYRASTAAHTMSSLLPSIML